MQFPGFTTRIFFYIVELFVLNRIAFHPHDSLHERHLYLTGDKDLFFNFPGQIHDDVFLSPPFPSRGLNQEFVVGYIQILDGREEIPKFKFDYLFDLFPATKCFYLWFNPGIFS